MQTSAPQSAAVPKGPPPPPPPPSSNTYPQIVRIRYLDGDVRVSRGKAIAKETGADWEQASADLELETGFNLTTGTGRAELEFEDASTAFLGENSVLALKDLHTTSGVPQTEITLLAGTLTIHVHPMAPGESFVVNTPTDSLKTTFPEKAYLRLNSFLDGVSVTLLKEETVQVSGASAPQTGVGKTVYYTNGAVVTPPTPDDPAAFKDWDNWVANRVALRSAAMKSVAAASGLGEPVPGMADMYGKGTFFPCKPYGTCWEPPADAADGLSSDAAAPAAQVPVSSGGPDFALSLSATSVSVYPGGKVAIKASVVDLTGFSDNVQVTTTLPAGIACVTTCSGQIGGAQTVPMQFLADKSAAPGMYQVGFTGVSGGLSHQETLTIYVVAVEQADVAMPFVFPVNSGPIFPCYPGGLHPLMRIDPVTGRAIGIRYGLGYAWAVCHTGAWIYRRNVYVWVPSKRRHHHRPIHWVKSKKRTGYVPLHPRDVAGKPPVNRMHEVYAPTDKKGGTIERTKFDPKDKIEELGKPPGDFHKPYLPVLAHAEDPAIAVHEMKDGLGAKGSGSTLVFDKKSQSFAIARDVVDGDKHKTVTESFEDHAARGVSLRTRGGNVETRNETKTRTSGAEHTRGATHTASAGTHTARAAHTAPAHTAGASHAGGGGHTGGGGHAGGGGGHSGGGHH